LAESRNLGQIRVAWFVAIYMMVERAPIWQTVKRHCYRQSADEKAVRTNPTAPRSHWKQLRDGWQASLLYDVKGAVDLRMTRDVIFFWR